MLDHVFLSVSDIERSIAFYTQALAPLASSETRQAVLRAESRPQALALLFMAPEFQRR